MNQTIEQAGAVETIASIRRGEIEAEAVLRNCRQRVEGREDTIGAWHHLDWVNAERQLDRLATAPRPRAPLHGLPVAVKDVFDTHDMPTGYGSPIYEHHRPAWDAACIARLRAAGAVIVGKTVTTEFAFGAPGKTCNPLDPERTPGASSSGSAAAVAAGMVSAAIASQTGASIIRPAAYCGIIGFKPSHGLISVAGVKAFSNIMDTVGVLARSVDDAALLTSVMAGIEDLAAVPAITGPPLLRLWTGPELDRASAAMSSSLDRTLKLAEHEGASVDRRVLPTEFGKLATAQEQLVAFEASRELADERLRHPGQLSDALRGFLEAGEALPPSRARHCYDLRRGCLARLDELFGACQVLVMPSACDVAPRREAGTGDPIMSRAWALLGLPSIGIPCGRNRAGLPLGLQLAGRPGHDAALLGVAEWFTRRLGKI